MTVTGPPEPIAPPPNDGAATRRASMDRSMVRGLAWTGGATIATQALRWSITLYIARILSPADYGLVGMALVYTGLVQLVNDFGLSSAIIQQRDLKADLFSRVAGFGIALGFALFALSAALAVPISYFFGEPAVRNIVIALGAKFILDSLAMPSRAMLARDLRFRALAAIDATDALVAGVAALVAALAGAAYWSLVIGTLAGSFSGLLLALWIRPYRPALPGRLRDIEHSVRLGRDVVVSSVAWYGYSNADFLIVGRLLDKTALGLYTFAWNIASIPVEKVAALVGRVTPGIFSAVQHDTAAMRRYFLSLTEAIAFVTLPMSAGFVLVADDLVRGLLGDKWVPAITTLKLLACYAGLRSVSTLPSHVMVMRGRADLARRASLITVMILPLAFLIGSRWGIVGVALGWLFAYPLCVVMCDYRYVSQLLELHPKRLAQSIWPAVAATSIMVLVLLAARMALPDGASHLIRLFVLTILGIAVYAGVALLTQGDRVRAFASVARQSLGRETSA